MQVICRNAQLACFLLFCCAMPSQAEAAWNLSGWTQWAGSTADGRREIGAIVSVSDENGLPVQGLRAGNFSFEYYSCANGHTCMYVDAQASKPVAGTAFTATPGVYELILLPCCGEKGVFTTMPLVGRVYQLNIGAVAAGGGTAVLTQKAQAFLAAPLP